MAYSGSVNLLLQVCDIEMLRDIPHLVVNAGDSSPPAIDAIAVTSHGVVRDRSLRMRLSGKGLRLHIRPQKVNKSRNEIFFRGRWASVHSSPLCAQRCRDYPKEITKND